MSNRDGGPAYPSGSIRKSRPAHDPGADFHITDIVQPANSGMTMRQAYKQAVMGLCPHNLNEVDKCAEWAGRMANAMLAEDAAHEEMLRGES